MSGFTRVLAVAIVLTAGQAVAQQSGQSNSNGFSNPWMSNASTERSVVTAALVRPDMDTPEGFRSYNDLLSFSRCATNLGRSTAEKALAEHPESASERRYIAMLQERFAACRQSGLPTALSLQRGSIAENLYRKLAKDGAGATGFAPGDAGYQGFMAAEASRNALRYSNDKAMIDVTDCLVAQQPVLSHTVVTSSHGSQQERQAIAALFAAAPSCAGAQRPPALSTPYLRAFLGDSAYQFALFRRAATPAGAG